jgi:radical SAM protein with 4Fe4S-binding SPASM domain
MSETLSSKQNERLKNIDYSLNPKIPKELYLELNNTCNHKCIFCSNEKMTRSKENIDKELAKRIMREAHQLGVTDISFFATGEPFLVSDLDFYIKYSKEIGFKYVFLTTNGALAKPKLAKKVIDAGLNSIKFSVNAGTRESYKAVHGRDDFIEVVKNIKWIYEYKEENNIDLKLYSSMVPNPQNIGEYNSLMSNIGKFLDDEIHQRECSNQGGNMLENNEITEINPDSILGTLRQNQYQEKKICPDPFNRIVVSSEGYLTACVVDYQNSLIISDLSKSSLKESWNNEKYLELRKKHLDGNLEGTICYNCLYNKSEEFKPLSKEYFKPFKQDKDMEKYKK